jgi:iron(III) transport system substrate-binding protein
MIAEPVLAAFEKRSGTEVRARFDTEASKTVGLVGRLRNEARRPVADVFWSSEVFHTVRLARDGLLAPYERPDEPPWPRPFTGAGGRWHGFALRARVVAYHTQRVGGAEAPSRLEDLLDPRWKGRLIMATPEFGTTGGHVAALFVYYGEARAREILAGLKRNGVRLVDGNSTAVRMVAMGQADVCLTDTDDVYAARRNGWPVAMNYLRHGTAGPLVIPNTVAIVAGCPHPEEARSFAAFLLGETAERLLVESVSHNTPVNRAVAAAFPEYAIENPLAVDYVQVAEALPAAITTASGILR